MTVFKALLKRKSGTLEVHEDQAIFVGDSNGEPKISLSLSSLEISVEGMNSPHYYLFDPNSPETRICVQDERILSVLYERGVSSARQASDRGKKQIRQRVLQVALPIAFSLALALLIPVILSFSPHTWLNKLVSPQDEKNWSEWIIPHLKKQSLVHEGHSAERPIRKLAETIIAANPSLQPFSWSIYVSDNSEINAFALPGHVLIINQGLLANASSVEEIAGVLAHEMGHVEQRHVLKGMTRSAGVFLGTVALSLMIGSDSAVQATQLTRLFDLNYSRQDEGDADSRGFYFLNQARINPAGMIEFFSKLAREESTPKLLKLLSTHPGSQERVEALKKLASGSHEALNLNPLPVSLSELRASQND